MDNNNTILFFLIYSLSHQSPLLDNVMIFITNYVIYLSLLLAFLLTFKGKSEEKKAFLLIILGIPISILFIMVIHLFITEPRPFVTFNFIPLADNKVDLSFPSRHATIMAVIAFSYTYLKSRWTLVFLILMVLVGISRIYVGVHYPLDILGGFITGLISLILALHLFKFLKRRFFSYSL